MKAVLFRGLIIRIMRTRWKVNIIKEFINLLVKSGPRDLNRQDETKIVLESQKRITSLCAAAALIKKARIPWGAKCSYATRTHLVKLRFH